MTIVAIRDGIMAVDSLVTDRDLVCGQVQKWRAVQPVHGGGFIVMCGSLSIGTPAADAFANCGETPPDGCDFIHLRADGSVALTDSGGGWCDYIAPFYALGSGEAIAIGAMAAGATAEEAVKIACEYNVNCGGEIHVLKLGEA